MFWEDTALEEEEDPHTIKPSNFFPVFKKNLIYKCMQGYSNLI